jgi:hypothetical protein
MSNIPWPDLSEPYNQALREAAAYVLDRYQPVGMIAAGSVVRGAPDQSSDIDLYVIHLAPFRQRVQKFFNGVPTEIFINPPHQVERYLKEEQAAGRPITAHMLTTGIALLESDPVVNRLRQRSFELLAQNPVYSEMSLIMGRYLTATYYEDALDLVEKDPAMASMLLSKSVTDMIEYCFRRNGCFLPRVKKTLSGLQNIDPVTAQLANAFFSSGQLEQRLSLAAGLAERILAADGFFEWETAPEDV